MRNEYKIVAGKPEVKRQLRRLRCRWKYNVKIDLLKTGLKGVNWIHITEVRDQWRTLVKTVMNLHIPLKSGNFVVD
jgi:hypothetical protein